MLEWSFATGDVDAALLLTADLLCFWFVHSHFGKSGAWYRKRLAERDRVAPRARSGAGQFSLNTGDCARAAERFEEARVAWLSRPALPRVGLWRRPLRQRLCPDCARHGYSTSKGLPVISECRSGPTTTAGDPRKLMFDVHDLDRLIDTWKDR